MNVASKKHELRQAMKAVLKELSAEVRRDNARVVQEHIATWLDEVLPHASLSVGLFASLAREIGTSDLDRHLAKRGVRRAVTCADTRDELCFYPLEANDSIDTMHWKLSEQLEERSLKSLPLDIIFVPGLAFDEAGNRLGRGRGCFDRGLNELPASQTRPILVGLLFDEQLVLEVPCAEHDIAVDYLCTPKRGMLKMPARVSHA